MAAKRPPGYSKGPLKRDRGLIQLVRKTRVPTPQSWVTHHTEMGMSGERTGSPFYPDAPEKPDAHWN